MFLLGAATASAVTSLGLVGAYILLDGKNASDGGNASSLPSPGDKPSKSDTGSPKKLSRASSLVTEGSIIKPPLPAEVIAILEATRLCHLSTNSSEGAHLSLMNFTYVQDEELIIMSTRRDTRKFQLLQDSSQVSLLIHDFNSPATFGRAAEIKESEGGAGRGTYSEEAETGTYSITLSGNAQIETGERAERLRKLHLAANPDYVQFIAADGIAVFTVAIQHARMCNIQDKVKEWDSKKK